MTSAQVAILALSCFALAGCVTEGGEVPAPSEFIPPSALLREEIAKKIDELPYLKGQDLLDVQWWLASRGEAAYEQLIAALDDGHPTTRSIAVNVLATRGDRRVIPHLAAHGEDPSELVRYEIARALMRLGDWSWAPRLVDGLRDERFFVRALCARFLREQFKKSFGFDPRGDAEERESAVLRWRSFLAGVAPENAVRK